MQTIKINGSLSAEFALDFIFIMKRKMDQSLNPFPIRYNDYILVLESQINSIISGVLTSFH